MENVLADYTVQDLINELNKIEDKSRKVVIHTRNGDESRFLQKVDIESENGNYDNWVIFWPLY